MTDKIRKRLRPVSVVATIAVLGLLAAFIALAALPDITSAQGPPPPPPPPTQGGGNGGPPAPPAPPSGDGPPTTADAPPVAGCSLRLSAACPTTLHHESNRLGPDCGFVRPEFDSTAGGEPHGQPSYVLLSHEDGGI